MPNIEIDGQVLSAKEGQSIIEVADDNGIYIPRFCYHKKLSVAANCRMCLVEVENGRKPAPACATPVMDGMKVFTKSEATRHSQKAVMEFLLINHPLDCPICDQGGQCELQDLALAYGNDSSDYSQTKNSVSDQDIGSLIATNMTRCIHCTRCIRFGDEIAGVREMGATGRGEKMEVGTYVAKFLQSELSGNIIDLCPVGALLSKPALYQARAWELTQHSGLSTHDCLGSNTFVHTHRGQVMRVAPRANEKINESWLSDRDRFSYLGINHPQRLLKPMVKINQEWQEVSWEDALEKAVAALQQTLNKAGAEQLGALLSPSATLEEFALVQQLWQSLDCHNVDYRLHQTDFRDQQQLPLFAGLKGGIAELAQQQAVLLIGSDIRHEQPLASTRLRQAQHNNAQLMAINPVDFEFNFSLSHKLISTPKQTVNDLAQLLKALSAKTDDKNITQLLASVTVSDEAQQMANTLKQAPHSVLLLGALAQQHPQAALIRRLSLMISELSNSQWVILSTGANSAGAEIAGVVPHRHACGIAVEQQGLTAAQMITQSLKTYLTLAIEPEHDCANSAAVMNSLQQADSVICLSAYQTERMKQYATVLLPITPLLETSGTLVNFSGEWQSFSAATPPQGEARPAWKVLRVLANLLAVDGFDYNSSHEIRDQLRQQYDSSTLPTTKTWQSTIIEDSSKPCSAETALQLIHQVPIYGLDALVRRALPLQQIFETQRISIHRDTAAAQQLECGEKVIVADQQHQQTLTVHISDRVPLGCALLATTTEQAIGSGAWHGCGEIIKTERAGEHQW